ncbi:MAG: type 2 isopentenyl-diphosphate Delta-isomerase [Promethearchaeota archaeon]
MDDILILKLGGSLLTDKSEPFSIREQILNDSIQQIVDCRKKLVLIHGGGSFGHPVAREYNISNGINPAIQNQLFGLTKTHDVMNQLNSKIIETFLKKDFPAISIQPSSIFMIRSKKITIQAIEVIEAALELEILPVLYGDIILDSDGSFSIISGDQIILEICKKLKNFRIKKVIFTIEKDGVFIKDTNNNIKLATKIDSNTISSLNLANLEDKIDVTGGIKKKLEIVEKICNLGIPVQIINGLENKNILKVLNNQHIECTSFKPILKREIESKLYNRKIEHIRIPLKYNVQHSKNHFDEINLIHHALPEHELDDINLSVDFFDKNISAPICIAAITGGHEISKAINNILANAANLENIIMSVGSQRIGVEDPNTIDSFKIVRDVAPDIPIIGNLGIGQICSSKFNIDYFFKCIEMINADVMAIHFNALHELVQTDGNISYKNFEEIFKEIRKKSKIPIIAKEVGTGFNKDLALKLDLLGFDGFDVGGTGGTSFAAIESFRDATSYEAYSRKIADTFREWGIPTPVSIVNVREVSKKLIIATGGLRSGIDIAKAIVLGANIGGFAFKFLKTAWKDYKHNTLANSIKEIKTLKQELRSSLWLMNIKNIGDLRSKTGKAVLLGELYQWINQ